MRKKSPYLRTSSFSNMAVRGGLTRFARPAGVMACGHSVQRAAPVVEPRSGILIPPCVCNMRKKSPYLRTSSFSNMAVRGGFEPPIRCRIHTFQACSFSHSDTSPYCCSSTTGTGANLGKYVACVNQLFQKVVRLHKVQATCRLIRRKLLFLPAPANLLC